MSVVLSEHLPLLATAPDGVQKLRGLILELAVRGKLVPQDPSDEPASELLKRIAKERARLETEGKIKKSKAQPPVREDEQPFEVPQSWVWTRLGEVTNFGQTDKDGEIRDTTWVLDLEDIQKDTSVLLRKVRFAERQAKSDKNRFQNGDVLYGKLRPYLNKVIVADEEGVCTTEILPVRGYYGVFPRYLMHAVKRPDFLAYVNSKSYGMKMPRLGTDDGRLAFFPLPPEQEQHRIVAKIDELMALCDRLEVEQTDAEAAHERLVATLLGTLSQSTDAADLATNWQRLAEHFDALFSTESSLDALKQTILQLAVMGKLVPPATSSNGNVLPSGWRYEPIEKFCSVQGGIQKTPLRRPQKNHFPYLRVANVQRGIINVDELERYELTHEELARWRLKAGDLLVVEGNGSENEIGRCAVWHGQVADCVYQNHLIRVRPHISEEVGYLQLFLNSPVGTSHMKRLAITTSGLFNLSVGKIRGIVVPLPPVGEQQRIVAKVDELMSLVGRLKASLAESRVWQERLATTLIETALKAA